MLGHVEQFVIQLKQRIFKGSIAETNHKIAFSRLLRTVILKFLSCSNHGGPIVDSGYTRISKILSVNSAQGVSKMDLLFIQTMFNIAFSSRLRTYILKLFGAQPWLAL